MKKILFLICFTPLLMAVSCHSSKNMVKLSDTKWVLETLDGNEVKMKEQRNEIFIQFNEVEKRVNGMAGCNRFFGSYEMDGSKLKFSHMGATKMACPDMDVESAFFKLLEETDSFSIKDHQLTLLQKGKVLAVFKAGEIKENKK